MIGARSSLPAWEKDPLRPTKHALSATPFAKGHPASTLRVGQIAVQTKHPIASHLRFSRFDTNLNVMPLIHWHSASGSKSSPFGQVCRVLTRLRCCTLGTKFSAKLYSGLIGVSRHRSGWKLQEDGSLFDFPPELS